MEKTNPSIHGRYESAFYHSFNQTSVFPLVGIILLFSILLCLYDFISWLWCILQNITRILLLITFKGMGMGEGEGEGENTDKGARPALKPCSGTKKVNSGLLRGDVEVVMDKMGIFLDPKGGDFQERTGSDEIADLFDKEMSLGEAKEAFDVFDKNCDGFIDANELEKVLCALGFLRQVTKSECGKMIRAYDENGDERIDFGEFVKLLETCSL